LLLLYDDFTGRTTGTGAFDIKIEAFGVDEDFLALSLVAAAAAIRAESYWRHH
jgi:hypothetical protein